jgi:glycosyltransferase involved in cell wall biosynthesis
MLLEGISYVIITPVRDEAKHLPKTIQSVLAQTIRPAEWIIVNDGSTDATASIMDEAAARYSWVKTVHRLDRGYRKAGGGVVAAFADGYDAMQSRDWDFMVKLDGDLSFGPDYFERCFEHFLRDPLLGIAGGSVYNIIDGKPVLEACPEFHVRGATKIYRRACWEVLGGLMAAPGWDTLDEVQAQMSNWKTRTFPELVLTHHRQTGSADGLWRGLVKNGKANYVCGYHPLFMAAKCAARLMRPPYVMGSLALASGFIGGYLTKTTQAPDALRRYVRTQQLLRLTGRDSIWR